MHWKKFLKHTSEMKPCLSSIFNALVLILVVFAKCSANDVARPAYFDFLDQQINNKHFNSLNYLNRGKAYLDAGLFDAAIADLEKGRIQEQSILGKAQLLYFLALGYQKKGETEKVVPLLQDAHQEGEPRAGIILRQMGLEPLPRRWALIRFSLISSTIYFPKRNDVRGLSLGFWDGVPTLHGAQVALLANNNQTNGIQIGIVGSVARSFQGIQIGGLAASALGDPYTNAPTLTRELDNEQFSNGLQVSILSATKTLNGVQIGFFLNQAVVIHGIQIGMTNTSDAKLIGMQIGITNALSTNPAYRQEGPNIGFQFGVLNFCKGSLKGLQVGIYNSAKYLTGVQIGIINRIENPTILMKWMPILNASF